MQINLSMDTWRDVFDFLGLADRKELALKCNGIGDRQFNDICQKWLHEWTKRGGLGEIRIRPTNIKGYQRGMPLPQNLEPALLECRGHLVPFAEEELPANIHSFDAIEISYLDIVVLQFLRRLQPLFHGVNLHILNSDLYDAGGLQRNQRALDHFMPLFTNGIECLYLNNDTHSRNKQLLLDIRDHFLAQFFSIKKLRIFATDTDLTTIDLIELLLHWLGTRRGDGEQRTLNLSEIYANPMEFIDQIRQHFHNANSPAKFFVRILAHRFTTDAFDDIQESTTKNAGTSEQLLIRKPDDWTLHIGRCPSEMDGQKWVEEMDKPIVGKFGQTAPGYITILYPTLGGPIVETNDDVAEEESDEVEVDFDQQGPSKKPELP